MSHCTKTETGTRAFEAWTSVVNTLVRTFTGPILLEAIVRLVHPASPQTA